MGLRCVLMNKYFPTTSLMVFLSSEKEIRLFIISANRYSSLPSAFLSMSLEA